MKKTVRRRHADPVKFVIYVLWIIGHSERTIAKVVNVRPKQVAGVVGRSEYSGRSFMSDDQRREKLKELESVRMEDGIPLDAGMLDRIKFEIMPMGAAKAAGPVRRRM